MNEKSEEVMAGIVIDRDVDNGMEYNLFNLYICILSQQNNLFGDIILVHLWVYRCSH